MKKIILNCFLLLLSLYTTGQTNLKGLWNGYITTENNASRARYMISIEEHHDGIISGKALIYKPNLYAHAFGLQQFYGTIKNNILTINDIQILDERLPQESFYLCFKLSNLDYKGSGETESLSGKWDSKTPNCMPGRIFLSRFNEKTDGSEVPSYVLNSIRKNGVEPGFKKTTLSPPFVVEVNSRLLHLEVRDYLREDNDTVSIYLNREAIFNNLSIKKKPYKFSIWLNHDLAVNEIIMYANNLGRIPPNTSYLLINDGKTNHKVRIESNLQKSAAIYLKYVR